jgi:pimeloyl-ACP methyl ester carboxylesterase
LLVYHHGTRLEQRREYKIEGEKGLCMGFATGGYQVVYPDYFGLGNGQGFHPYLHAQTEAQATLDMLRAIKELNAELNRPSSGQLFLTGYSQGGHATMAAHKYLQQWDTEFQVTASAPMSGAYDIGKTEDSTMFKPYPVPGYLPYLLLGLDTVHHYIDDVQHWFKAPYDTLIPPLMTGQYQLDTINDIMPRVPAGILKPWVRERYLNDPDFILRRVLRQNSVYDWKPESPVMLCYCKSDQQVNYRNAIKAHKAMKANGAERVLLTHAGRKYGHRKCALFTAMYAKLWFDSFVKGSERGRRGSLFKRLFIGLAKLVIPAKDRRKDKQAGQQKKRAPTGHR